MQVYSVKPFGALYRVVDYEGQPLGRPFVLASAAQNYADALNQAHQRHRIKAFAQPQVVSLAARHQPNLVAAPSRATVRQRLRALVAKINRYRQVRIGL